eukprot:CAMPEP_0172675160 /NCGR_PEP_ID=MMETSP1074-20121228/13119_1 /TAXON_ID=2916 /ORGANISM="Ceratium fusus, Strain PA161109" /LENGTH=296 /DNA_ID=CAMNT_0013492607 /DNA_START=129 /DNA_END=1015 /DNA_ORIENTATION=-
MSVPQHTFFRRLPLRKASSVGASLLCMILAATAVARALPMCVYRAPLGAPARPIGRLPFLKVEWQRRATLSVAVVPLILGHTAASQALEGSDALSQAVDDLIEAVDVFAVTDNTGAPMMRLDQTAGEKGGPVGLFYFDEAAAVKSMKELREQGGITGLELRKVPLTEVYQPFIAVGSGRGAGIAKQGKGTLRLEPFPEEVRHAQQIMQGASLGPPGSVPLFVCRDLEMGQERAADAFVPAFLREADLRTTLKRAGAPASSQVSVTTLDVVVEEVRKAASNKFRTAPRMKVVAGTSR